MRKIFFDPKYPQGASPEECQVRQVNMARAGVVQRAGHVILRQTPPAAFDTLWTYQDGLRARMNGADVMVTDTTDYTPTTATQLAAAIELGIPAIVMYQAAAEIHQAKLQERLAARHPGASLRFIRYENPDWSDAADDLKASINYLSPHDVPVTTPTAE